MLADFQMNALLAAAVEVAPATQTAAVASTPVPTTKTVTVTDSLSLTGALGIAPFIYLAMLALGRWLKRKHKVALSAWYHFFCIALAGYLPLRTLQESFYKDHCDSKYGPWFEKALRHFGAVLILLGVVFFLALLRRFYWQKAFVRRYQTQAPKFLQQIFGFALFVTACAMVATYRYGAHIDAFLTGSGIIAVVIGFAMQDTLANIVSGIALEIGKPFKVGDWLVLDKLRAEVVEVNWRSTKLRTNDDIYLDIPNKTVVGSTITNYSYPTRAHAHRMRIGFEYTAPPNSVRDLLKRATENADGVMDHPLVKVFLVEFGESAIIYEIKYSLEDESRFSDIENHIRTNVWYEAHRAGFTFPFPIRTVHLQRQRAAENPALEKARMLLPRQELFAALTAEQKEELIAHASILRFGRGEDIIKQGNEGCSMFIVLTGEVDVLVSANGEDMHVATIRPGEAFGEMCMLTGEKRTATIVARTDTEIWEIRRAVMQPILQESTHTLERMSELLAKRKIETEGILATQTPRQVVEEKREAYAQGFLKKISSLFEI